MWTLIALAVSALLWLVRVTLGAEGAVLDADVAVWLHHAALGSAVLAGVLVLQRVLQHVVRDRRQQRPATSDLLHAVLRIALYLVALMLYLRLGLHLDISSVLATSAMMSVVIGLALQPTLGHLFAGVSMEIERPLKVGDFVRRDDQLEGQVTSLNWRSVYLRTERGSTLVLPNSDFTSKLIEVIPGERPYRHQVGFSLPSDVPPDRVIHIAQQVVRSDLPGVCRLPVASVVVVGNDPVTGTLRYVARLYTLQFLDRSSIASAFLERLWYALSREGLALLPPPVQWWPLPEPGHEAAQMGQMGQMAQRAHAGAPMPDVADVAGPRRLPPRLRPVQAGPRGASPVPLEPHRVPWPGHLPEAVTQPLLRAAQQRAYGPREACPTQGVCLVLGGRLREDRPLEAPRAEQALRTLLLAQSQLTVPLGEPPLLDDAALRHLLHEASLALGPVAHSLCQRLAALTDDAWLAWRAVAESLPDAVRRADFLARGPAQSSRALLPGDWLGWARVLGQEPESVPSQAVQGSTLLVWTPEALRGSLRHVPDADLIELARLLRVTAPGCESVDGDVLRRWCRDAWSPPLTGS